MKLHIYKDTLDVFWLKYHVKSFAELVHMCKVRLLSSGTVTTQKILLVDHSENNIIKQSGLFESEVEPGLPQSSIQQTYVLY